MTYRLSDFLLFSPQTYFRQFELYNSEIWPAQALALVLGAICLWLALKPGQRQVRGLSVILAAAWLWVAWGYLHSWYATINWAAEYLAGAFAIQAIMILLLGLKGGRIAFGPPVSGAQKAGLAIFVFALIVQPLLGFITGQALMAAEVFGLAPNPTVAATLGLFLAARQSRWELMIIPTAWCIIEGLTRLAMEAPDFWLMPAIAMLTIGLATAAATDKRYAVKP